MGDFLCYLEKPPLPPVKLHLFFDKIGKKGPYKFKQYKSGKDASFDAIVKVHYGKWSEARAATKHDSLDAAKVKEEFSSVEKEKKRQHMDKARMAAQESLKAKRLRTSINLETGAPVPAAQG